MRGVIGLFHGQFHREAELVELLDVAPRRPDWLMMSSLRGIREQVSGLQG